MFVSIIAQECDLFFLAHIFTSQFFYEFYMAMYHSAFNHFYRLLVLIMRTSTKTALAVMFIITSSVSLMQSGFFSSFSQHSSTFPITNDVYASNKKTTDTDDSPSSIP